MLRFMLRTDYPRSQTEYPSDTADPSRSKFGPMTDNGPLSSYGNSFVLANKVQ